MTIQRTEPQMVQTSFYEDLASAEVRRAKKIKMGLIGGAALGCAVVGAFVGDALMGSRHYDQGYEKGDADGSVRGAERIVQDDIMKNACATRYLMHLSHPELFANENFTLCVTVTPPGGN
jgi:hypothetical protein